MIKSTDDINKQQLEDLILNHQYVDEVHIEHRKGVSQTRYIFVAEGCVDKNLNGFWMQKFPEDNSYYTLSNLLDMEISFVRCKPVEITVTKWEKI